MRGFKCPTTGRPVLPSVTTSSATSSVSAPALTSTFPPIAADYFFSGGPWPCWASWKPLDHPPASTRHGRYLLARALTEPVRLLRRPGRHALAGGVPALGGAGLADGAAAAQPEAPHDLGPHRRYRRQVPAPGPHPPPVAGGSLRRHPPEIGARCPNRARRDLRGGRVARPVPTATGRQARKVVGG